MAWKVKFYHNTRGDNPVMKFIQEQDESTYARILLSIKLLQENGPYLKPPYIKKLQNNLYELRISSKIAIRIFYTIQHNEYYLIHAFKKKSQKTPKKELKLALDRLKEII